MSYVLGFVFSHAMTEALLIEKKRPLSMRGLWNGIGGAMKAGETPAEAMSREMKEETGLEIDFRGWVDFGTLYDDDSEPVHLFAFSGDVIFNLPPVENQPTDERVMVLSLPLAHKLPLVADGGWLIEMAISKLSRDGATHLIIRRGIPGL